jgi:hypothetical protein
MQNVSKGSSNETAQNNRGERGFEAEFIREVTGGSGKPKPTTCHCCRGILVTAVFSSPPHLPPSVFPLNYLTPFASPGENPFAPSKYWLPAPDSLRCWEMRRCGLLPNHIVLLSRAINKGLAILISFVSVRIRWVFDIKFSVATFD